MSEENVYVEIGTSCFDVGLENAENGKVFLVEPRIDMLKRLPNHQNIIKCPFAILDINTFCDKKFSGEIFKRYFEIFDFDFPSYFDLHSEMINCARFFYVSDENIKKYSLPQWAQGCCTLFEPHPTLRKMISDDMFDQICVPVMTIMEFLSRYKISFIKYMKIDTEGGDAGILYDLYQYGINYKALEVDTIVFEWNSLTDNKKMEDVVNKYVLYGYIFSRLDSDNAILKITRRKNEHSIVYPEQMGLW